jgi:O-6-methylguanine DNA methyltransferase
MREIKLEKNHPNLNMLSNQLKKYIDGKLKSFNVPLDITGTTFQNLVWNELKQIPIGELRTYKDIALNVGGANYSRAVGMANNKNPIPILVPCHRVIGSNNALTGYALGIELKERLLKIEGAL